MLQLPAKVVILPSMPTPPTSDRARDLGDFQTPLELAREVWSVLNDLGIRPGRVLEPTCGTGNFLASLPIDDRSPQEVRGIELQPDYAAEARRSVARFNGTSARIIQADLFAMDFRRDLQWQTDGPLVIVGNPPWITSAELSRLGSSNIPEKSNFLGLSGLDAVTGAANFDLGEAVWMKLLAETAVEYPTIALLCKTSVARNVIRFIYQNSVPAERIVLRNIDARKWFNAAVGACLLIVRVGPEPLRPDVEVFDDLSAGLPSHGMGLRNGTLIRDTDLYDRYAFADGSCPCTWRQGIKHDAASVMVLRYDDGLWINGLGETVDIEDEYRYPLVRSTELFHQEHPRPECAVIVPQRSLSANPKTLTGTAPRLWRYLCDHGGILDARKSSMLKNRPRFSVFGVGEYTFAPYKVAISGFHKECRFRVLRPFRGKSVIPDDTSYFIACRHSWQTVILARLLNSRPALGMLAALRFDDAKRPTTKRVLERIDLREILKRQDTRELFDAVEHDRRRFPSDEPLPPDASTDLEELLFAGVS